MKKYVFSKSIYLGFLKKNFNAGDVIELNETNFTCNEEKINDLRDIKICIRKGYVVPFEGSKFDSLQEDIIEIETETVKEESYYGFKVDKGENVKTIPISKLKTTVLDESKVFVEEDGEILNTTNIFIAPAVTKTEINDSVKDVEESIPEPLSEIAEVSETNDSKESVRKAPTAKKATSKKAAPKKSKVDSKIGIESEKVTGTVRGMNIIKSE